MSHFTAGLKLRAPLGGAGVDRRWVTPVRLATLSTLVTVGVVTALGHLGLGRAGRGGPVAAVRGG